MPSIDFARRRSHPSSAAHQAEIVSEADPPRVRQRVAVAEQAIGKEDGRGVRDVEGLDCRQSEPGKEQADLLHGRACHPVRGIGRRVERSHEIGERAAAGDDEDWPGRGSEDRDEGRSAVEEGAAELDHEGAHGGVL